MQDAFEVDEVEICIRFISGVDDIFSPARGTLVFFSTALRLRRAAVLLGFATRSLIFNVGWFSVANVVI